MSETVYPGTESNHPRRSPGGGPPRARAYLQVSRI